MNADDDYYYRRKVCTSLRGVLAGLFFVSSIIFFCKRRAIDSQASIGLIVRRYFIGLWCVAHVVRGIVALVEPERCRLLQCIGDLPFFSSFLLFVLFLGHVNANAAGSSPRRLVPVWAISNGLLYLTVGIFGFIKGNETNVALRSLGIAYALSLLLLLHNRRTLLKILDPTIYQLPDDLLPCINRLSALLALVFVAQCTRWFVDGFKNFNPAPKIDQNIDCDQTCVVDFFFAFFLELTPTYVGMFYLGMFSFRSSSSTYQPVLQQQQNSSPPYSVSYDSVQGAGGSFNNSNRSPSSTTTKSFSSSTMAMAERL